LLVLPQARQPQVLQERVRLLELVQELERKLQKQILLSQLPWTCVLFSSRLQLHPYWQASKSPFSYFTDIF
jgi:hypothetical protein